MLSCSCLQPLIFIIVLAGVLFVLHVFHVLDPSRVKAHSCVSSFSYSCLLPALFVLICSLFSKRIIKLKSI